MNEAGQIVMAGDTGGGIRAHGVNGNMVAGSAPVHMGQLQSQFPSQLIGSSQLSYAGYQGANMRNDLSQSAFIRSSGQRDIQGLATQNPGQVAWNPGQVAWNVRNVSIPPMDRFGDSGMSGYGVKTGVMADPLGALSATGARLNSQYSQNSHVNPGNPIWNVPLSIPNAGFGGLAQGQLAWDNNVGAWNIVGNPEARLWQVPRPSGVPVVTCANMSQTGLAGTVNAGFINSNGVDPCRTDGTQDEAMSDSRRPRGRGSQAADIPGRPRGRGEGIGRPEMQERPGHHPLASTCVAGNSSASVGIHRLTRQQPGLVSSTNVTGASAGALGNKVTVDIDYLKSLEDGITMLSLDRQAANRYPNIMMGPGAGQSLPLQWGPRNNDFNMLNYQNGLITPQYVRPIVPGLMPVSDDTPVFGVCELDGVADKVLLSTLKGEFCDLSNYLSNLSLPGIENDEMSFVSDKKGNVQYKVKRQKRQVKSFSTWLEAWVLMKI